MIETHMDRATRIGKRSIDIAAAVVGLTLTAPLLPLIALAIKVESPGPVLFRQVRVGRMLEDRTELFQMIKFRSMRQDAESASGAVWASKRDPRITRVGNFMRKTRLDEIPQFINVLRGEMSLIGPRPERPEFYRKLEAAIPHYSSRTFGLKPGITGLAQVSQGYDETIEDVRSKVMFDHAYAVQTFRFSDWLRSDLRIVGQTLSVMALGRGQ
ncbi:MAG: sugar transferase [Minwuia sp.]|nr:sugar transferase [Minwuia sp.]